MPRNQGVRCRKGPIGKKLAGEVDDRCLVLYVLFRRESDATLGTPTRRYTHQVRVNITTNAGLFGTSTRGQQSQRGA